MVFRSNGQQTKPGNSGYASVNGIKVYYEVYGKGEPLILLHGAIPSQSHVSVMMQTKTILDYMKDFLK